MASENQKRENHVMVDLEKNYASEIIPPSNTYSMASTIKTHETHGRDYARPYYATYKKPRPKLMKKRNNRMCLMIIWTLVFVVISVTSFGAGWYPWTATVTWPRIDRNQSIRFQLVFRFLI